MFFLQFYANMMPNLPSKLKPLGPPKNALKMLLASKSGGDTENTARRQKFNNN